MKQTVFILISGLIASASFGQGQIRFDNRVTGTTSSAVVAPVYGVDHSFGQTGDPSSSQYRTKSGNAATGPTTPIPAGTQTYGGVPITGSGFTASLWARRAGSGAAFQLFATTPFRVTTSTALFGFWTVPNTAITLTGIPSDPSVRAEIIIGVWDNQGGTITSWDQLYDTSTRQANFQYYDVPRGISQPFVEQDQLGGGTVLPATLKGLQSFQLWLPVCCNNPDPIYHIPVPEPSTFAMILLGAGGILWFCRHRGVERR